MLGENKNLKDTSPARNAYSIAVAGGKDSTGIPISLLPYNKTNKLITALYMVTDTMEKEEPIRLRLRTLGVEILSDITMSKGAFDTQKIDQTLSFLNIASDIRMISEMNCNILRKEFTELKQSIQEFTTQNHLWLEGFIQSSSPDKGRNEEGVGGGVKHRVFDRRGEFSKGHPIRIGVQKGSTLMDALSKVGHTEKFEVLKNKRRGEIIAIIKNKKNMGTSITDIKNGAKETLVSCGEKTLQRELISMVKDNVLKKTGEKRWSQYFLQ